MLTAGKDRRMLTIGNSVDSRDRQKNFDYTVDNSVGGRDRLKNVDHR